MLFSNIDSKFLPLQPTSKLLISNVNCFHCFVFHLVSTHCWWQVDSSDPLQDVWCRGHKKLLLGRWLHWSAWWRPSECGGGSELCDGWVSRSLLLWVESQVLPTFLTSSPIFAHPWFQLREHFYCGRTQGSLTPGVKSVCSKLTNPWCSTAPRHLWLGFLLEDFPTRGSRSDLNHVLWPFWCCLFKDCLQTSLWWRLPASEKPGPHFPP